MSIKLRELIRNVRACKTAAEERAVIAKESALCRSAIKDPDNKHRHRNVAKLLYIHMLGYPTQFGQMETLKLIASPKFSEKRIGYLALMILLDERQGVLMLVTNTLKNDFENKNAYVAGLALATLANISSADMARDLQSEVKKFFRSHNPYLRKKAALCAIRIVRKVPELVEDFVDPVVELLNDKNNAVLLTTCTLMAEMIRLESRVIKKFRKSVPNLVRLLKNLVLAGYVSEYDVVGITDPFLQCAIIKCLRLLGTGDQESSEYMNDVLAQVAINTEPTKNPGNAILYECVQTIMSIEAEGGLRVLGVNILGRFLLNKDNNIRYVALNTLCKVVNRDTQAVQRHRNTIVDCLRDADISIKRRALELLSALFTKNNVKALVRELLNYLELLTGDGDFKTDLTEKICQVAARFAPSKKWHIETLVQVLAIAGSLTREKVTSDLILLIGRAKTLQPFSVHKLYLALKQQGPPQLPLVHVALWCVGEYGDYLLSPFQADGESFPAVGEGKILHLVHKSMKDLSATIITKEYGLNALVKLAAKFSPDSQERIRKLVGVYRASMTVELQQRSVEYQALLSQQLESIRGDVMNRMPMPAKRKTGDKEEDDAQSSEGEPSDGGEEQEVVQEEKVENGGGEGEQKNMDPLVDIFAGVSGLAPTQGKSNGGASSGGGGGGGGVLPDDLLDIFAGPIKTNNGGGGGGGGDFLTGGGLQVPQSPAKGLMENLFQPASPVVQQPLPNLGDVVIESAGLSVWFAYQTKEATPNVVVVTAAFGNSNSADLTNFDFQVAVPKYLKLTMKPATSNVVAARSRGVVTQMLKIENTMQGKKPVVIRVKIGYQLNGQAVDYQGQIDKFPINS